MDDNSSNVTVTGNVVGPPQEGALNSSDVNFTSAFLVHNGDNNSISGNIVDLGDSGMVTTVNWGQDGGNLGQGMGGNSFVGNIVISSFTGNQRTSTSGITGYTYVETMNYASPAPNGSDFTIWNNVYKNYAGGQVRTDGNVVGDGNPIFEDPQISGWLYSLAAGSPVSGNPVNFPHIVGGWGPPGFVIPRSSTGPSSPH